VITGPTQTTVTHLSNSRFAIRIRSHEIFVDQTIAGGGNDAGPTPLELLGAGLGSCIAYYVHQFLHTRGLAADGIRVTVSQTRAQHPTRIDSFSVRVELPAAIPSRYVTLLERVIEACPAHNTLLLGTSIDVSFMTPASELAVV
jgi:putative redox protein